MVMVYMDMGMYMHMHMHMVQSGHLFCAMPMRCRNHLQFAPRDRATKVNLPGRIGKTAFNAYDAEAAAADAAAAPASAEPGLGTGGLHSSVGLGSSSPHSGVRRTSVSTSRQNAGLNVFLAEPLGW